MSCPDCKGTGFIYARGDYYSPRTGKTYKGVERVVVCPGYLQYFAQLSSLDERVLHSDGNCDAGSRRHEEIQNRKKLNGKDTRKKF